MDAPGRSLGWFAVSGMVALGLAPSGARAESWCAERLTVHEWGVHVFGPDGVPRPGTALPDWFHATTGGSQAGATAVRDLPADSGVRALPILQFYGGGGFGGATPVGIEVGFTGGSASTWYPQVDLVRTAAQANGAEAALARARLALERVGRGFRAAVARASLPPDPTRQLVWNMLALGPAAARPPHASTTGWVDALRGVDGALWVNGAAESERFVYYEAETREAVPLRLERDAGYAPGHRALALRNVGPDPVHDVFVTTREGAARFALEVATLAPGAVARFVLEDHAAPAGARQSLADLRAALVEQGPTADASSVAGDRFGGGCTMLRDPAVPFEKAEGHRLFASEVDVLIGAWGERFFGRQGTTILYREDLATLERAMPLSLYTDMFHFISLRRAGLALWEKVPLP